MKQISYEEIGGVVATFLAGEGAKKGQVVGISTADTVDGCAADGKFCGLALDVTGDGVAAVQVSGFAQVPCGDAGVTPGWVALAADGTGGVKKAASGGREYLVVSTDTAGQTAVVLL